VVQKLETSAQPASACTPLRINTLWAASRKTKQSYYASVIDYNIRRHAARVGPHLPMKMFSGSLGDWYLLPLLPLPRPPRIRFQRGKDASLAGPAEDRVLVHILANDGSRGTQKIRDVTLLGSDAQMEWQPRPGWAVHAALARGARHTGLRFFRIRSNQVTRMLHDPESMGPTGDFTA